MKTLVEGAWYWVAGNGPWRYYRQSEAAGNVVMRSPHGSFNTFAAATVMYPMTPEIWATYKAEYESRIGPLPEPEMGLFLAEEP